ncbi:hypothetical protein BDR26DRAFT_937819 [Obelidium mucronatum]|nr:hypothetical protein BDR26DRAFT_937819 [Obelidium mucronatum]
MALLAASTAEDSRLRVPSQGAQAQGHPSIRHGFTPSPSLPDLDFNCDLTPQVGLFDNSFDAAFSSASPSDFDLLSSFGTPFDMASMVNVASPLSVYSGHVSNNVYSKAVNGFAAATAPTSPASAISSPSSFPTGFDFMSTFGTPFDLAPMDVTAASSNGSAVVGNNVSSQAVNGSTYSSTTPSDFDFLSSFGTPFNLAQTDDVASALSNFGSVGASSNVLSFAGNGSSSSAPLDSLNWLDSLASSSAVPVAKKAVKAATQKKASSVSPSSPTASVVSSKGNQETAVSSVYTSKVVGTKQTVEHPCACKVCGVAVATMVLRGSVASFQSGYLIDVTCDACSAASYNGGSASPSGSPVPEIPNLKIVQSRKRARKVNDNGKAVHCDVCQAHVGSGGVQVIDAAASESNKRHCGESGVSAAARKSDSFTVEVVCAGCRSCFGFCTECGGGGKYRTGKYRPFALFQDGRRTCSLPHFRLGDTKATHTFVPVSAQAAGPLAEAKVIFSDSYMAQHAVPKQLSGPTAPFRSALEIQHSADAIWFHEEARVAASFTPGQYVAFASIPKSSRKKSRAATAPGESSEIQMACFTAEHSVDVGVLEIKQVATRVTAAQSSVLLAEMVRNAVASLPFGSVEHVVVSSAVLSSAQIEKLGAVSVEAYLASAPVSVGAVYLRQKAADASLVAGAGAQLFVVSGGALV